MCVERLARQRERIPCNARAGAFRSTDHMLTKQEQDVARSSIFFSRDWWGSPEEGLSPEGKVAQSRGAKFTTKRPDDDRALLRMEPSDDADMDIATQALADVAKWLGFEGKISGPSDSDRYLPTIAIEGADIFKRAK